MFSLGDAVGTDPGPRQYPFGLKDVDVGYGTQADLGLAAVAAINSGDPDADRAADIVLEGACREAALERQKCRFNAINRSSNLTVCQLEFVIMNGSGSFSYTTADAPWQKDLDRLYETTRKNSVPEYMQGATQSDWEERCCSVLLHESDFNYGISASSVSYPVSLSVRATMQNRCRFLSGVQFAVKGGAFPFVNSCPVNARPVCCAIYTNAYITVSENSATMSSFLMSQASLTEAMNRAGETNQM
jgi:hypothetical protein